MMNKKKAMQIAKLWNEQLRGSHKPTMTEAQVEEDDKKYSVRIKPIGENYGNSFHHAEELTDICRAFGANGYISISEDYEDGKIKRVLIARIF